MLALKPRPSIIMWLPQQKIIAEKDINWAQ